MIWIECENGNYVNLSVAEAVIIEKVEESEWVVLVVSVHHLDKLKTFTSKEDAQSYLSSGLFNKKQS